MNYEYWKSNVKRVLDESECRVVTMTTLNILSLPSFVPFLKDMIEFRKEYDSVSYQHRTPISFNYLRFPPHLQVTLLPKKIREKYVKDILKYVMTWHRDNIKDHRVQFYLEEINQIERFCDYMLKDQTSGPKYQKNFVQFIEEYDKRRKKNFVETFPELAEIFEMWKEEYSEFIMVKNIE